MSVSREHKPVSAVAKDPSPRSADAHQTPPNPVWQTLALRPPAIQYKLAISQPDDPYEKEADHIASIIANDSDARVQTTLIPSPASAAKLQGASSVEASADSLQAVEEGLRSLGQPLDSITRDEMALRFGSDFRDVRVHADAQAAQAAQAINAQAFTLGQDIVFGMGRYAPRSGDGRRLLAHELAHVQQQSAVSEGPLIQRTPTDQASQPEPLVISGATFAEAARNFAQILRDAGMTESARIVVINGPNVQVFDQAGVLAATTAFRLHGPTQIPVGVFRPVLGERQYHVILRLPGGGYDIGGRVAFPGGLILAESFEEQHEYDQAVAGVNVIYVVSPRSTATSPQADAPQPPEELPEFMQFVPSGSANLPAWPAAVIPLTPQLATVNSTGTFMCKVDKNQGLNTLDRVTNLLQRTNFRWEVLKLDPQLRVTGTGEATRWAAAREGYARRLRNLEADRQTILGEDRERQGIPERILRTYFAEQMTQTRTILAMAGQTVMTFVNAVTGGTNQLSTADIIEIPWPEEGDYFVRCLATPESEPDAPNRRATSVAGVMVSVYDIEEVASESIPSVEREREQLRKGAASAESKLDALGARLDEEGDPETEVKYQLASLEVDYQNALLAAIGDERARKAADLAYVRAQLRYLTDPTVPTSDPQLRRRIAARIEELRRQERQLARLIERVEGRLPSGYTYTASMRGVLVDEWTSNRTELTFSIGETTHVSRDVLEIRIADITAERGRVFSGEGSGMNGAGRREAWQLALRDLRRNLGRGRGYLLYRVPGPYAAFASETPNPMQLQVAELDQLREAVDDTAHSMTLAALVAAPFTGGASLGILAVLAPIQAGSSLYNIVNRAMYDDLQLDAESVNDFINIATLGFGRVGQAGQFSTRAFRIIAAADRVAALLLQGGGYVVMTWQAYHEMTREVPGEAEHEGRRRRLLALLSFMEGAAIPVAGHLWPEGHQPAIRPRPQREGGEPGLRPATLPGEPPTARPAERPPVRETPSPHGEGGTTPAPAAGAARRPASPEQLAGLSSHFRDHVFIDESLPDTHAQVNYRLVDGLITDVHITVGPHATAADIRSHVPTAELMLRYGGFNGRLRILLEQITGWFTGRREVPVGSRAWEARLELEKLQRMMRERSDELHSGVDYARRDQLMDELDSLQAQLIDHAATLDSLDLSPGRGYVAASGVSTGREVARQRGYPDPPEDYIWRYQRGELQVVRRGEGLEQRYFDEAAWRRRAPQEEIFPVDTRSREEPRFESGTTRREAFRDLGGYEPDSEFGRFVKMLLEEGLIRSREEVIRAMQAPETLTWRTVRHDVKERFLSRLMSQLTDVQRLRETPTYQSVLRTTRDPVQARRAASHVEMMRITNGLASADRGSIGERWYSEMYGSSRTETQVSVTREQMSRQEVEISQDRNIDLVEGNTARELKNVSGAMGQRERGQITDLIAMLGGNITVRGRERRLDRLVETFLDPRGALANAEFMREVFGNFPNANITFELYTATGQVIRVTRANYERILTAELRTTLGLPRRE